MSMQDAVDDAIESGELVLGERKYTVNIPGPDGEPSELEVWEPTMEQIAYLATLANGKLPVQRQIAAVGDLMQDLLSEEDYDLIWARLRNRRDPLKMEHVMDAISEAMEKVQDFPTQPSSGSSVSSGTRSAGKRSTGRVRGPGSTSS